MLDNCTDMKWSDFLKYKNDLKDKLLPRFTHLKARYKIVVVHVRCDNAGENKALEKACIAANLGIQFEYTASGTPQHNARCERGFATLFGRVRACMNAARLPKDLREGLWAECANTCTKLDNILVRENGQDPPYKQFYGEDPKFVKYLRTWGEMGIVANHQNKKIRAKLADRGRPMMFVGYAEDHAGDVYRMWNPATKKIVLSRDIQWLNKSYGEWKGISQVNVIHTAPSKPDDDDDDDGDTDTEGTDAVPADPGH